MRLLVTIKQLIQIIHIERKSNSIIFISNTFMSYVNLKYYKYIYYVVYIKRKYEYWKQWK